MGILERIGEAVTVRQDANDDRWWQSLSDFVGTSASGKNVTPKSAVEGTVAVYAAVGLLAETVGTLPFHLYDDGEIREKVGPSQGSWPGTLARMFHQSPNPEMSAHEYWETVEGHTLLWGNHYSWIRRDGAGRPQQLWPLRPDRMEVARRGNDRGLPVGPRVYVYRLESGERRGFGRSEILHVTDFATDGLKGLSRIQTARNAVGIEQAAGEYAGRFFSNSSRPDGVLTTEQRMDADDTKRIRTAWENLHRGLTKSQRVGVLHSGLQWQSIGVPPNDAQFIEQRRFQIEEIARLYRIPPHLLGAVEKSTSWGTGIEQQTIGFVVYTLRANLKRIEAAVNRDLGDPDIGETLRDGGLVPEFSVEGLLRGDMQSRAEFYSKGIQDGWLVPNDARALENRPPLPGLDRPRVPLNFALVDENGELVPVQPPADVGLSRSERIRQAYEKHMEQFAAANGDV